MSISQLITQYSNSPNEISYIESNKLLVQWNNEFVQCYDCNNTNTLLNAIHLSKKYTVTTHTVYYNTHYHAIVNNRTLLQYSETTKSIAVDKTNSVELYSDVFNIHTTTHIPAVVCIHNDNSITFVQQHIVDTQTLYHKQHIDTNNTIDNNTHIVATQLISTLGEANSDVTSANSNFLFITRQHTTDNVHYLDVYSVKVHNSDKHDELPTYSVTLMHTHTIQSPSDSITLSSSSVHITSATINLLWSNGTWQVYQFASDHKYRYGNMIKPLQLKHARIFTCYSTTASLQCRAISDSCVIVVGRSQQHSDIHIVTVWESVYATLQHYYIVNNNGEQITLEQLQTSDTVADTTKSNKKRKTTRSSENDSNAIHITVSTDNHNIAVALPKCMIQCNVSEYIAQSISLSSVMGRMKQLSQWIQTDPASPTQNTNDKETEILNQLLDAKLPADQFESTFNDYYNSLLQQYVHKKSIDNTDEIMLTPQKKQKIVQKHVLFSNAFMDTLLPHILNNIEHDDKIDAYCNVLNTIISTNSISARNNSNIIPILLQQKQDQLLQTAVVHIHDIPESQLIDILCYALHNYSTDTKQTDDYTIHLQQTVTTTQQLLDVILSSPRSNIFLKQAIKVLTTQQLHHLLQYILLWLQCYYYTTESQLYKVRLTHNTRFPTMSQLIDWCTILIDTHFSTLLLLNNKHDNTITQLIQQLITIVQQKHIPLIESAEQFNGFLSCFAKIDEKRKLGQLTPIKTIQNYQIELLQL